MAPEIPFLGNVNAKSGRIAAPGQDEWSALSHI